jgi:hypothetical protein
MEYLAFGSNTGGEDFYRFAVNEFVKPNPLELLIIKQPGS